jgi:hypothetical protein
MNELDIQELRKQASQITNLSQLRSEKSWSNPLPEKRIEIGREELSVMETALASKLLESDAEETTNFHERPTSANEAVPGAGGYKLDGGKPRWELAPFDAIEAMVTVLTWAADKKARGSKAYPERNWERGMHWSRPFGAMMRHAWKWWQGKILGGSTVDEESGMSHMWHAFTCAAFLVTYELRKMDEFDDRPNCTPDQSKHHN